MKKKWTNLLPWLWIVLAYAVNIVYLYRYGRNIWNSDVVSELMLGDLLNETGGILTEDWYYSSELRVLHDNLLCRAAMAVFPNDWHAAHVFASALGMLGIALGALYVRRALKLGKAGLWWTGTLLLPFGQWYAFNVIYGIFYIPCITISLFALGLLLRLREEKHSRKRRIPLLVLSLLLAFGSGLNGYRQMMIFYAPLVLAELLTLLLQASAGQDLHAGSRNFLHTVLLAAANLAGILVNTKVLTAIYHFYDYSGLTWDSFDLSSWLDSLSGLLSLFGWHSGADVTSAAGLFNVLALILSLAVLLVPWRLRKRQELSAEDRFTLRAIGMMVLFCWLIYSQTSSYNESYWIPLLPFLLLGLCLVLQRCGSALQKPLQKGVLLLYVLTVAGTSCCTMRDPYISGVHDGRGMQNAAQWLVDNGCTEGYGTFWNSNILTGDSDGQIATWTVFDLNYLDARRGWLVYASRLETSPEGRFFIIADSYELSHEQSGWVLADYIQNGGADYRDDENGIFILTFENEAEYEQLIQEVSTAE